MSATPRKDSAIGLPEGYAAVPVCPEQAAGPLRICILVRRQPDPVVGHFVVLRDMIDAQALLGCIVDLAGRVQKWVEVWVQNTDGIADTVTVFRETLTNAVLDERWTRHYQALSDLGGMGMIETCWECKHPLPIFLDVAEMTMVHLTDAASGGVWLLCEDDALLTGKGLPSYGSSLHRYLHLAAAGAEGRFIPITSGAPANEHTVPLAEFTGEDSRLLPVNPAGGFMMVREHEPIGMETLIELLGGGSWEGTLQGRSSLDLVCRSAMPTAPTNGSSRAGWLFLGAHGRAGRMVERFHLKLRLLTDAFSAVRDVTLHQQRPHLNLLPESFRVRLGGEGCGLPFLWTARVALADPGNAVALPIRTSDAQYYLRAGPASVAIYRPSLGIAVRGQGSVRIRRAFAEAGEATVLEGTFFTQERLQMGSKDLLWFRLNLGSGRADLYAHLESRSALASGEWRFRTIGQRFSDRTDADLRSAEGVPIANVPFEVVPLLSSPYDLYSLGVLAVRTLLVDNKQVPLAVALDEMLSLARQVATEHDGAAGLAQRIRAVFERDPRWADSLGPHRLSNESMTPAEAFALIPADLWWETLAAVVRLFPGMGPDSECKDFGDAHPGRIHEVFDHAIAEFNHLVLRSRSLIVIDWKLNREIHSLIRVYLNGLPSSAPAAQGAGGAPMST